MNLREKFFNQVQCETYNQFLDRIYSFEKPEFSFGQQWFEPSASAKAKVDERGKFKHFIGDTTVFDLSDIDKYFITKHYIDPLYNVVGDVLAERFCTNTLHMTLHDLNSTNTEDYQVVKKMFYTEIELAKKISNNKIYNQSINMVTTCVFNMVNTSLVLGLVPETEDDYIKLMTLYNLVDSVQELPYPLTPHITLAYYAKNGFYGEKLHEVENIVNALNHESFYITLYTDKLYYQKFINMNKFISIMPFVKGNK